MEIRGIYRQGVREGGMFKLSAGGAQPAKRCWRGGKWVGLGGRGPPEFRKIIMENWMLKVDLEMFPGQPAVRESEHVRTAQYI